MSILKINQLSKKYPAFELKDVSFTLEPGKITGFIGRNGAGKSTTLKAMLNVIHPDNGEILFFDQVFQEHEIMIKQRIGFVSGGIDYYPNKKLKTITAVTQGFYKNWDKKAYHEYMSLFHLDENKTPSQLSEGMKVKYAIVLALSHKAELLILDEPTSGLDPVSRDELLDIFMELCEKGITILFSTHITSDLDKCADHIIYIKNGEIIADSNLNEFLKSYKVVEFNFEEPTSKLMTKLIGYKKSKSGHTALMKTEDAVYENCAGMEADLESIMVHLEKEEQ